LKFQIEAQNGINDPIFKPTRRDLMPLLPQRHGKFNLYNSLLFKTVAAPSNSLNCRGKINMGYEVKKTEHSGAKKGCGAYWGRKADAKKQSNRRRRKQDKSLTQKQNDRLP
jgi:hypothetical protein